MVRFLNLDDPAQALAAHTNAYNPYMPVHDLPVSNGHSYYHGVQGSGASDQATTGCPEKNINLEETLGNTSSNGDSGVNNSGTFARVLASYPCIRAIVNDLDQNDLYNLSMTCRQFRANMLENRKHLLSFTLRCKYSNLLSEGAPAQRNILKISNFNCVTDLVFRCLDCDEPVCRNCKAKVQDLASNRLGQMCTTCRSIPLADILNDSESFLCRCKVGKGESWACKPCALRRKHHYTIRGRTWDKIQELDSTDLTMEEYYEFQCTRGQECFGNGWEKCSSQEGLEIRSRGRGSVPTVTHKDRNSLGREANLQRRNTGRFVSGVEALSCLQPKRKCTGDSYYHELSLEKLCHPQVATE